MGTGFIIIFDVSLWYFTHLHIHLGHEIPPFYFAMISQGCSITLLKRLEATTYTNLFGCLLLENNYIALYSKMMAMTMKHKLFS